MLVGMGIDPGLKHTGIAAVAQGADGGFESRGVRVVVTEPDKRRGLRVSVDDVRRYRAVSSEVTAALDVIQPHVVGIETYSIFEPRDTARLRDLIAAVCANPAEFPGHVTELRRLAATANRSAVGLGQASKTLAVVGICLSACWARNIPAFLFEPADRTRRLLGRRSASKEDVGRAITEIVSGLQEQIQTKITQRTRHEHAWDATCHAILGIEQYTKLRLDQGI